jgi:CheY-like chemotaxis protein
VDADPSARHLVTFLLESEHFEVLEAEDAAEALRLLRDAAPFDLAVMDLATPERDGTDLLGALGRVAGRPPTIVLLTDASESGGLTLPEGLRVEFLVKPFEAHVLRACITRLGARPAAPTGGRERRRRRRIAVEGCSIELFGEGPENLACRLVDISPGGLGCVTREAVSPGTVARVVATGPAIAGELRGNFIVRWCAPSGEEPGLFRVGGSLTRSPLR